MRSLHPIPAALAAALLAGCGGEKPATVEDITSIEIGLPSGTKIVAEAMRLKADVARGMMFRDALPEGRGMLFVYSVEGTYPFWMHQVKVPLDMIWIGHDHRVVEIATNTKPCLATSTHACPFYGGHQKARYILEVNAGVVEKNHLTTGDLLAF